jgi:MFS transporter, DHA2 family, multidrug resistance protein
MIDRDPRRWWALFALVPAILAVGIDATVLSLALPALSTSFHASTAELQWFIASYTLVFAAAMVPGGMLGDRFGRKKLLLIALVIFAAGSLACAYAPSAGALIAARALLGLGAAVVLPMVMGMLPVMFGEEERPKAVAVLMAASMLGFPIGPILGGWLLTTFWWGSVFLINLPMVVVALVAALVLLPESRSTERRRLDPVGIVSSSAGLAALTYGIIEAGQHGWGSGGALAGMLAGAAVLVAFVLWERRTRDPLIDLGLFRSRGFTWGTILTTVVSFAMFGISFAVPQYFQDILGFSALGNGVRQLTMIAGLLVGAVLVTRVVRRTGAKAVVALGFVVLAGGLFLGATTGSSDGAGFAMLWLAVAGLGLGFVMPVAMDAALGALSAERAGVGSALIQALRMVGGSFGAAMLGSVLNSAYRGGLDVAGLPAAAAGAARDSVTAGVAVAQQLHAAALLESVHAAFIHGLDVSLLVCGGLAVAGAVLAVAFLPSRAGSAQSEAADGVATTSRASRPGAGVGDAVESPHGASAH